MKDMRKLFPFPKLAFIFIVLVFGCTKEDDFVGIKNASTGPAVTADLTTNITGQVLDPAKLPVSGVTVKAYGQSATTDGNGTFLLESIKVNRERCLVRFSKPGFMDRVHGFIPSKRGVNYVNIVLTRDVVSQAVSATAGGLVTLPENASIDFQPNSFVTADGKAYTGSVNLSLNQLSPDMANFGYMIPGGDLLGIDANGQEVSLYSYGMVEVEMKASGGAALQLAPGSTATLRMPIAPSQSASAPGMIALWSFDEATALWNEEGMATKNGNYYVGTVSHFSKWNVDYKGERCYVKGKVKDCSGIPIPNATVTIDGWWHTYTDQSGQYENWMPAWSSTYTIKVHKTFNNALTADSQQEKIPPLTAGQLFTVPDLVIPCHTRIAGQLVDCQGEPAAGSIRLTGGNGYFSYLYTADGSFNTIVPGHAHLTLKAFNLQYTKTQYVTTSANPGVHHLGNVHMCDSLNLVTGNFFTLNAGPFQNQKFDIQVGHASAGMTDSTGTTLPFVNVTGTMAPDYTITLNLLLNDSLAGMTTSHIQCWIKNTSNSYYIETVAAVPCMLGSGIGPIGTAIDGFYGGNIRFTENEHTPIFGNMSGSYDVVRTE